MNSSEYKKYHESFMEDNHGSSAIHTFFCIFFTVQCSVISGLRQNNFNFKRFVHEYLIIVLPMVTAHTFLSEHIYYLNAIAFIILIYEVIKQDYDVAGSFIKKNKFKMKILQSISLMRGLTYLITVFAILAVDFRDFPRPLAKTERYGYSLMDTGVGLFALMSGLVHKDIKNETFSTVAKSNLKFASILTLLGIARFLSVKQLDYQEHITEYGVHWNFFFTLAICKLLSTIFLYFSNRPLILSILTLITHELALYRGVRDWVFSNTPRNNLLSANREGLSSSLGYVSLYLFAVHIKNLLCNTAACRSYVFKQLLVRAVSLSSLTFITNVLHAASRTLANAAYCIFLEAVLCIVLTVLYILEVLSQSESNKFNFETPVILSNVNRNGLSYFLISNLLTGAVNMSMRTLLVPSYVTFIVLNAYMILNISFTVYMKNKGFRI